MKGFDDVSRAATCDSGVILESCSPESVVAKRRDSVQKPYGMTSGWGGRTVSAFVKRLVVMFLICLFATVNAPAEIISAVSYNPSRMGDYVYLKVADKANLKGGIESNTMTVRSGGTVSASSPNLNYDVPAVVGASGSTLDMPNTAIHGSNANTYNNYQAVNTGTPSALLNNVNINGGQTTVKNDSYISTLDAVNRLKQKAATLRANKLSVSGSEDASLYDGATTDGFTLAGNDIPQPTSSHVNTGSALSNCQLAWEDRVTSDNQKVKLLALTNCNGATPSTPETDPCEDNIYKVNHKSECCSYLSPKGDTDCWLPLSWTCEEDGLYSQWEGDYCGNYESYSCSSESAVMVCSVGQADNTVLRKTCTCDYSPNGW
ncbi:hypothetical protein [Candidatus Avelusimicrobium stercoris]|uniref:hypothetical protein n=1 Tax=Candidatus Avelusimicrobium stercoris TaxID=1947924 RepID=UPI003D0DA67D